MNIEKMNQNICALQGTVEGASTFSDATLLMERGPQLHQDGRCETDVRFPENLQSSDSIFRYGNTTWFWCRGAGLSWNLYQLCGL